MSKSVRVLDLQIASYAYPERSRRGFTLVELLVVVSIIAILSVIGITVFSSAQKTARNARRQSDIDATAKSMEINYGRVSAGSYARMCQVSASGYDCAQWFNSGSVPADPIGTTPYHWCDPTDAANNPVCAYTSNPIQQGGPDGRANWMVCASLEGGGKFCRRNQQ